MENEIKEIKEKPLKINKKNVWLYVSMILGVFLIISLTWGRLNLGMSGITGNTVSKNDIGQLALTFFNSQLSTIPGTLDSVQEVSGVYQVNIDVDGKAIPIYFTKDGNFIYPGSDLVPITKDIVNSGTQNTQAEIPKSDKPIVNLFVMGFCPYGVKAENNILPIVELLKDKIDFKIRYIVNVGGDTIDKVSSLHGINEAKEDARQLVILKYYPDKFYDYLKEINNNCYSVASDASKLDECWKAATEKLKIDIKKVETAAYGSEGIELLKLSEADAKKYNAGASPTLIINGVKSTSIYDGTAATQTAICNAFNNAPSECSQTVAASSANTPTGSCS